MSRANDLKASLAQRFSNLDRNRDGRIDRQDAIALAQTAIDEAAEATRKKPWGALAMAFALGVVLTLFVVSGR